MDKKGKIFKKEEILRMLIDDEEAIAYFKANEEKFDEDYKLFLENNRCVISIDPTELNLEK